MRTPKIRKFGILIIRTELDDFFTRLITLGCTQIEDATEFSPGSELYALTKLEVLDLERYDCNKRSVSAIGTKCSIFLTGFIPSRYESEFTSMADEFTCAWQIEDIPSEDYDLAPVELGSPWLLGKYRLAGRILFDPLKSSTSHFTSETYDSQEHTEGEG